MAKLPPGVEIIAPVDHMGEPSVVLSGKFRLTEMVNILRALELASKVAPNIKMSDADVSVSSLVDADDFTPWVSIENSHLDQPLQLPASGAAELAYNLLSASEAALQDAALMLFMRDRGMPLGSMRQLLVDLRGFRSLLESDGNSKEDDSTNT